MKPGISVCNCIRASIAIGRLVLWYSIILAFHSYRLVESKLKIIVVFYHLLQQKKYFINKFKIFI